MVELVSAEQAQELGRTIVLYSPKYVRYRIIDETHLSILFSIDR